jgi:transcriptional regulator with XRE-family HTH domain
MARNFKELQARMDPADRADNVRRVRDEIQRMALDELRRAKQLTQADMAEMLDVPQSSISRIEQRADMYLSTLRNYVHALGGVLQIQAVFPDGGAVAINRLGEYEDAAYVVRARAESSGLYQLFAQPRGNGVPLSTRPLKPQAIMKTLKALHVPEPQISALQTILEDGESVDVGGKFAQRVFSAADLIAAGFEAMNDSVADEQATPA